MSWNRAGAGATLALTPELLRAFHLQPGGKRIQRRIADLLHTWR